VKEYTKRRNINRGYMRLEVWQEAMELLRLTFGILSKSNIIEFKLRGQVLDAVQSISGNISEGYCRRTVKEYLYYCNVALGSLGESLTRMIGLHSMGQITDDDFEKFDALHYSIENKLLALVKSLQKKQKENTWIEQLHEPEEPYNP
jgi:four helix bundle protein